MNRLSIHFQDKESSKFFDSDNKRVWQEGPLRVHCGRNEADFFPNWHVKFMIDLKSFIFH